jgi:hypothetical protein
LKTKGDNCHITVKMGFNQICLRRLVLWLAVVMLAVTIMVSVILHIAILTMSKIIHF